MGYCIGAGINSKVEGGGEDQWDIALGRGFGRHAGISRYGDLEMREITVGIKGRDSAKYGFRV